MWIAWVELQGIFFDSSYVSLLLMLSIGFKCITKEADLMCELLKQGAKHYNDIFQLSSVIRMCALGLVDLTGNQSMVSAAAMMVSAYLPPINMC